MTRARRARYRLSVIDIRTFLLLHRHRRHSRTGLHAGDRLVTVAHCIRARHGTADHLRNCVSASGHFNFFLSRAVSSRRPPEKGPCAENARDYVHLNIPRYYV
jgi:hypothetical protein